MFTFTVELLDTIKAQNKKYLLMTNNSSKSVEDYVKKLEKLGIKATKDEFLTSSQATAPYLKENCQGDKLYVCGTRNFRQFENVTKPRLKTVGVFF